ncbi:MAG TPA: segregation/condensation protein A [Candidatus Paceibacterota bacterium]|jgi:segregation and condensation protein A|nr:segregation/condensation protein A [Candidatus Paceibacterota bacterium]
MPIDIKTPVYEGPLDLLLELIEKRKLLINDISLASVTDEYIAKVNGMHELPVGETAEFISLAATLLLIKSRSLLPTLTLSDEETRDIKELEYRLALYQLIKEAARGLNAQLREPYLYEGEPTEPEPLFIPDTAVTPASLRESAQALINGFPTTIALPKVEVKKIMSLEEMIGQMSQRITSAFRMSFKEFSGLGKAQSAEVRHGVIVSFLALLELVKQGILRAQQEEDFGDITMESDSVSTPTYE